MDHKKETVAQWFEQYGNDIYHFLIYRTNINVAEDLLQDVFIKALKGIKNFKKQAHPKTWLLSIARNVAIDDIRKKQTKKHKETISLDQSPQVPDKDTPASIFHFNDEMEEIYQSILHLKGNYKDVIILRSIQELSVIETARILEWSESKVTSTHYRARLELLKQLRRLENDVK